MKTSESTKNVSAALVAAQRKMKHATKDSNNTHFRNDYASLESVIDATKPALVENGLILIQGMSEDGANLVTRLQHSSGEFLESYTPIVLSKNDMQGLGSAITYARRYASAAMLNISQADDDGNVASGRVENTRTPPGKRAKASAPVSNLTVDDF